ncbi:MAG: hypothetical protein QXN34_04335 [Archaeoglobaceae archaeon]
MDLICPFCDVILDVVREEKGKFRRRYSEFDMQILVLKCPKCKKLGILRVVPELEMENLEFPYESCI